MTPCISPFAGARAGALKRIQLAFPVWALTALLCACQALAQPRTATTPSNTFATAAEVTAFMNSIQTDPGATLKLESNPKRLPLLLESLKRDPTGPWAVLLLACCFQPDRAAAASMPAAQKAAVYANAVRYLSTARGTIASALQANPRSTHLEGTLAILDKSIDQAQAEMTGTTNQVRSATSPRPASNSVAAFGATPPRMGSNTNSSAKVCEAGLKQINLAKQMWAVDQAKAADATPTPADLTKYFPNRQYPKCPGGGKYTIGRINQKPTCSVAGHQLPASEKPGGVAPPK